MHGAAPHAEALRRLRLRLDNLGGEVLAEDKLLKAFERLWRDVILVKVKQPFHELSVAENLPGARPVRLLLQQGEDSLHGDTHEGRGPGQVLDLHDVVLVQRVQGFHSRVERRHGLLEVSLGGRRDGLRLRRELLGLNLLLDHLLLHVRGVSLVLVDLLDHHGGGG